jgi:hypothetical protein
MSFIGSSERWNEQATARLCQLILEENNGMAQQIAEGRTDLLDLCTLEQLQATDDLGLSLPFLAIYHDRPDALKYLHRRGVDLSLPCDPMTYGTPYFYAVTLGKCRIFETLNSLLYSYSTPCETVFQKSPQYYIDRNDNMMMKDTLEAQTHAERRAFEMLQKHYLRRKCTRAYEKQLAAIWNMQRLIRGFVGRRIVKHIRRDLLHSKQKQHGHPHSTHLHGSHHHQDKHGKHHHHSNASHLSNEESVDNDDDRSSVNSISNSSSVLPDSVVSGTSSVETDHHSR